MVMGYFFGDAGEPWMLPAGLLLGDGPYADPTLPPLLPVLVPTFVCFAMALLLGVGDCQPSG
jgi:hypothetical protein